MTRRECLQGLPFVALGVVPAAASTPLFHVGLVPSGKTTVKAGMQDFWQHADEAAEAGVHEIEFNNTRAGIAEAYLQRIPEFRAGMAQRKLLLPGLAQFSHMDRLAELDAIRAQHLRLGQFLAGTGGRYITHMLAPSDVLNEVTDEDAYSHVNLQIWARNLNEVARQVFEQWGITIGYHPEQREVSHHLYESVLQGTDGRYVRFIADVGHLAAGGADPVAICRTYRARLLAVHLKDFAPAAPGMPVLKAGNVPFGKGVVDLPGVVAVLKESGFDGWVMGESGGTDSAMSAHMREHLGLTF